MESPLRSWIDANTSHVSVSESINPIACTNSSTDAQCSDSDRSIFAQSAILAEQELVTLQDGAYLTGSAWLSSLGASPDASTTISDEDVQKLRNKLQEMKLSPTVQLVMALLFECGLKEKSRFAGYIEQLPKRIPLPMSWSEKARRTLKHTAASPSIDDELVANMFKSFGAPLAEKFPSFWSADELVFERFQWAYTVVSSRAFTISDAKEPTLLPVIDMANHDHKDPAAKIVKSDNGAFQLVALRDIAKDEAVTISYGDLSNAELLCRYGFVLPEAVSTDCILVTSGELLATYTAFLNNDADNEDNHTNSDSEADKQGEEEESATKKRKLFTEKSKKSNKESSGEDDSLYFLLHGDQEKEFGLADALLSFVFAKSLPTEVLYDVLAVLLRKRDKVYSDALEKQSKTSEVATADDDDGAEPKALVHLLNKHERNVCRRILLGIISLEVDSGDEDDEDDEDDDNDEESAESYEDGDDDDDDEE